MRRHRESESERERHCSSVSPSACLPARSARRQSLGSLNFDCTRPAGGTTAQSHAVTRLARVLIGNLDNRICTGIDRYLWRVTTEVSAGSSDLVMPPLGYAAPAQYHEGRSRCLQSDHERNLWRSKECKARMRGKHPLDMFRNLGICTGGVRAPRRASQLRGDNRRSPVRPNFILNDMRAERAISAR